MPVFYNELLDMQEQIFSSPDFFEKWVAVSVGKKVIENKVLVRFNGKYDENKIKQFKEEISNSSMVTFSFSGDELLEVQNSLAVSGTVFGYDPTVKYYAEPGDALYSLREGGGIWEVLVLFLTLPRAGLKERHPLSNAS